MSHLQSPALVLRRHGFSETSLTVSLLTRGYGRVDVLAKGCLREKSPLFGHLDLYQLEDVFILERPQAGLDLLIEAAFVDEHVGLRFLPSAFAAAGLLGEIALLTCMPRDPHPELFDLTAQAFRMLSSLGEPAARAGLDRPSGLSAAEKTALVHRILRHALTGMLSWLGFGLETDKCAVCGRDSENGGYYLSRRGGIVCPACRGGRRGGTIGESSLAALRAAVRGEKYDENALNSRERRELLRFLVDYCQYMVEKPLHSAGTLLQLLRA